ncbi:MAG: hypothetical protein CSA62_02070 [Planctomycetota bacterium]|nr:MAG: hypothetical protein CSA62_02070 [Planctomycetota bacterium]
MISTLIATTQASLKEEAPLDLPGRQKFVAITIAVLMIVVVAELVRRRKLREEYSILWVLTATALFVLAIEYRILFWATELIGAATPHSTLFLGALLFLMLLSLQFSIRNSRLTNRQRKLGQRWAELEERIRKLEELLGEEQNREHDSRD